MGLAIARHLAQQGKQVIVAERHGQVGQETSSRNSEGTAHPIGISGTSDEVCQSSSSIGSGLDTDLTRDKSHTQAALQFIVAHAACSTLSADLCCWKPPHWPSWLSCHASAAEHKTVARAVIHAGIYYPTGSLKAKLAVRGKQLLYQYAAERSIPHKRLGKLIVATSHAQVCSCGVYSTLSQFRLEHSKA